MDDRALPHAAAGQPSICFSDDRLSDPKWTLAGVRFIGEDTIEITTNNGDVVRLDIDPDTLSARSGKLDRCTDADYPTWSD